MKTPKLSAKGGSALGGKKLILCIAITVTAGMFLSAGTAFAAWADVAPSSHDYGNQGTSFTFVATNFYYDTNCYWFLVPYSGSIQPQYHSDLPSWISFPGKTGQISGNIGGDCYDTDEFVIDINRAGMSQNNYHKTLWFRMGNPFQGYTWKSINIYMNTFPPRSISGDVKDYNNNGISGADIYLNGNHVTDADGSGHYTIGNLSNGSYAIEVRNVGYNFKSQTVDINGGNVDGVNFYTIFGYVRHGDGTVISGANIKIDGQLFATTQTDGSYRIGLPSGTYNVTAEKLDYPFNPFPVTITNTSKNYIHFYTYLIKGRVTRYGEPPESAGLLGMNINITKEGETIPYKTTTTDGNGNYEKKVPGGTYTIEATNP